MLEVGGLSAGYGQARILHDISVNVGAGEIVAILGANGAGKTTFFRSLFGFTDIHGGTLRFGDLDLRDSPAYKLAQAGLVHVPEGRGLFPGMTVLENLMVPVYADPKRARQGRDPGPVFEIFPKLKDRAGQAAGTMSGGEQQMLAIGRGLMAEPRLLLLDEPSIGLAPKLVDEVFERLAFIHEREPEMGILIVEQSVADTIALCSRGYVMDRGSIVLEGPAESLASASALEDAFLGKTGTGS
jgi:branched-chain amino acid transport system ATP-binding protein